MLKEVALVSAYGVQFKLEARGMPVSNDLQPVTGQDVKKTYPAKRKGYVFLTYLGSSIFGLEGVTTGLSGLVGLIFVGIIVTVLVGKLFF